MLASGSTLLVSVDEGCSWKAHPDLTGLGPVDMASHPEQESRLWVVTGRTSASNALYVSEDGGASFSPTALQRADATFTTVRVAPSNPSRLYVAGYTAGALRLWRSDDAGATWEELPQALPTLKEPYDLRLLVVAERDENRLWARVSAQGRTWLLESTDGGRTLQPVLAPEDFLVGAEASADGRTVWVSTLSRMVRLRDGQATTLMLPEGNACAWRQGSTLYGCGSSWVHSWALATSQDEGDTWQPIFGLSDIQGVLACPAASTTAKICGPRWPQMSQLLRGPAPVTDGGTPADGGIPGDGGTEPPRQGACSAAGSEAQGLLPWLLLHLAAARRWRRVSKEGVP
jgi:photosystem II stability/assembly factor-like uncharacterized protein